MFKCVCELEYTCSQVGLWVLWIFHLSFKKKKGYFYFACFGSHKADMLQMFPAQRMCNLVKDSRDKASLSVLKTPGFTAVVQKQTMHDINVTNVLSVIPFLNKWAQKCCL